MVSLVTNLAPLVLGVLLALTGASKAFGRQVARQAAGTALVRILNDGRRATLVLRTTGAAELLIAAGLLAAPITVVPAIAGDRARRRLPRATSATPGSPRRSPPADAPPGTTARSPGGPSSARAWSWRAGPSPSPPGRPGGPRPPGTRLTAVAFLVAAAAVLVAVSSDLDHLWLVPLRKARIKVFGHPLIAAAADVPVAASVQLLERTLAWLAASPVVRSGLIDHWEADGWRFLQFSGVHETPEGGARPVTVLFALDPHDTIDTAPNPAVRVTLIDDVSDQPVDVDLMEGFTPTLPMA